MSIGTSADSGRCETHAAGTRGCGRRRVRLCAAERRLAARAGMLAMRARVSPHSASSQPRVRPNSCQSRLNLDSPAARARVRENSVSAAQLWSASTSTSTRAREHLDLDATARSTSTSTRPREHVVCEMHQRLRPADTELAAGQHLCREQPGHWCRGAEAPSRPSNAARPQTMRPSPLTSRERRRRGILSRDEAAGS